MAPSLKDQAVGILQPALLIILGVYRENPLRVIYRPPEEEHPLM